MLLAALPSAVSCGEEERPAPIDPSDDPTLVSEDEPEPRAESDDTREPSPTSIAPDASLPPASTSRMDAGSPSLDAGSRDAGVATNCGDITCRGHGRCVLDEGAATCECDDGYVSEGGGDAFECVVDTSCKKLRLLEDGCRFRRGGAPAVATFFAVDYCAGTAVLPEDLGDLDEAFRILENGADIHENEESVATVIERDVESFVTIALDVSKSVTGVEGDDEKQAELQALVVELRSFVSALRAPEGEPEVTLSVLLFGRFVAEYVPFTKDLDAVEGALARIALAPDDVVQLVGGDGTALRQAVEVGIQSVERIQALRRLVTDTGVLTSGALMVVTDGRDSSNADLNGALIEDTKVNVISVGISNDIDDEELAEIGRDGSFLAPTPEDWSTAFAEVAQRVDEYPDRAYLLSYCSSATTGSPTVSVSLRGEEPLSLAECEFDADLFSSDVADVCNLELFEEHCNDFECGTGLACGACADDQCCAGGRCRAPSNNDECRDQHELCVADGELCAENELAETEEDAYHCVEPLEEGSACEPSDDLCAPGQAFCAETTEEELLCALVTLQNADVCGDGDDFDKGRCPERNCAQKNPDNPTDPYVCQREARVFEACSGSSADAVCESGAVCKGSQCEARTVYGCSSDEDCLSGHCNTASKACVNTGMCHWNWASKVD